MCILLQFVVETRFAGERRVSGAPTELVGTEARQVNSVDELWSKVVCRQPEICTSNKRVSAIRTMLVSGVSLLLLRHA